MYTYEWNCWVITPCGCIVCVTGQRVGSDSWRPYEGVMSTVSCLQPPCSAPGHSRLWLLLGSQFVSYVVSLFSCCLLFFLASLSFLKNAAFVMCPKQDSFSFIIFASGDVSGLVYPCGDRAIAERRVLSSTFPVSPRASHCAGM